MVECLAWWDNKFALQERESWQKNMQRGRTCAEIEGRKRSPVWDMHSCLCCCWGMSLLGGYTRRAYRPAAAPSLPACLPGWLLLLVPRGFLQPCQYWLIHQPFLSLLTTAGEQTLHYTRTCWRKRDVTGAHQYRNILVYHFYSFLWLIFYFYSSTFVILIFFFWKIVTIFLNSWNLYT